MRSRHSISLLVFTFAVAVATLAQSTDDRPLGDVARENNAANADGPHAKKIYANEDLTGTAQNDQADSRLSDSKPAVQQSSSPRTAANSAQSADNHSNRSGEKPVAHASRDDGPPAAGRRGALTRGVRKRNKKDNTQRGASANRQANPARRRRISNGTRRVDPDRKHPRTPVRTLFRRRFRITRPRRPPRCRPRRKKKRKLLVRPN
jgi:hypothetical protein